MPTNNSYPQGRTSDIVVQQLEDEVMIYDLSDNKAFCLNKTSAVIWQACNGQRSIAEIAEVSGKILNSLVAEELVWLALEKLKKDNLLEKDTYIEESYNGLSRREVIRKFGFSSMIALPIISSLVAPTASSAASAVCPSAPCRCPNNSASCNGSTSGVFVNCFTTSGSNSNCNCIGPFNAPDSGNPGFKSSTVGCTQ